MCRSVGEVESIRVVCGSLVDLSRERETSEEKIREHERKKESVKIEKKKI